MTNLEKLSFGTTRHSLFLLPYIFVLVAIGIQLLLIDIKKICNLDKPLKLFIISIFIVLSVLSLYGTYLRFDPLKTENIQLKIREFSSANNTNTITLLDCDFHYAHNDFTEIKATYDLKDPLTAVPLNYLGPRLLDTQTIKEIENFSLDLKKGDELITKFKDVKIKLLDNPYFKENQIFYDSLNFDSKSNEYFKRNNAYSRPNSVYILPIEVTSLNPI